MTFGLHKLSIAKVCKSFETTKFSSKKLTLMR